jgi:hypothetical protein
MPKSKSREANQVYYEAKIHTIDVTDHLEKTVADPTFFVMPAGSPAPPGLRATMDQITAQYNATQALERLQKRIEEIKANVTDVEKPGGQRHRRKAREATKREKVIIKALCDGSKGAHYFSFLDSEGAKPKECWKELWPGSHAKAYKVPQLRKAIQDEKSKVRRLWEKKLIKVTRQLASSE